MLAPDEALHRILNLLRPLGSERVPPGETLGRVLAEPVAAARTLPAWDSAAMDGYAVRAAEVAAGERRFRVAQAIFAGQSAGRPLQPKECARIMTGAPLPPGADAVQLQEKVRLDGSTAELLEPVVLGQNVRPAGEEARAGEQLLAAGTAIGLPEAGLLWGQGAGEVAVVRRPRVAIAATGDELCPLGTAPDSQHLVDTNSPTLAAAVARLGGSPDLLGIAPDSREAVEALFERGLGHDVLITSAGASVGERDFARPALEALGVRLDFWRVAMRPGKPLAVGTLDRDGHRTVVFGLPGNPTSSLVSFELFVRPAIKRLLGYSQVSPARAAGRLAQAQHKPAELTVYVRATARWENGTYLVQPLPTQSSGTLRSAAQATHLICLPPGRSDFPAGEVVELIAPSWVASPV